VLLPGEYKRKFDTDSAFSQITLVFITIVLTIATLIKLENAFKITKKDLYDFLLPVILKGYLHIALMCTEKC